MLLSLGTRAFNTYAQDYTRWSLPEGAKARLGKGHLAGVIAYSPDRELLAVASSIGIWIYDSDTGATLDLLTAPVPVSTVVFSPDGHTLASGSWDDGIVRLWDIGTGQVIATLTGQTYGTYSVAFSPDGAMLASGGNDKNVRLWDTETGAHLRTLTGHTHHVLSLAFSPDGQTLASGGWEGTVLLWDTATGAHKRTLTGHTEEILGVAFSPDGRLLASGSEDGTVLLWNVAD